MGDDAISHYTYHIQATLIENKIVIQNYRNQAGRFILATNLLDEEIDLTANPHTALEQQKWTPELILKEYKSQQSTERGFRFIKDPLIALLLLSLLSAIALSQWSKEQSSL
ncbi:hypothetical protein [uncultured Nostoc sp.]|uniref:hypothetical protein n=1 Tax=uncultured Nostoc sp. TaxID=340711 RepID=UPI0035CA5C70